MQASLLLPIIFGVADIAAQNNASTANGCGNVLYSGTDTVIFTVPYTYAQVMSIIGDYQNLTWSCSPAGSVTFNGTDNTVGTVRTYILRAHTLSKLSLHIRSRQMDRTRRFIP
jgi:hypothetical protein